MSLNEQLMNDCRTLIKNNQTLKALDKLIIYEKYYKRDLISALNLSLCLLKNLSYPNATKIGIDACDFIIARDKKNMKAYYRRGMFYKEVHNWYYAYLDFKRLKKLGNFNDYDEIIDYCERLHYETLQTAIIYEYEEDILYLEFFSTLKGHNNNLTVEEARILFDYNNKNGYSYFLDDFRIQIKTYYTNLSSLIKNDKMLKDDEKLKKLKENDNKNYYKNEELIIVDEDKKLKLRELLKEEQVNEIKELIEVKNKDLHVKLSDNEIENIINKEQKKNIQENKLPKLENTISCDSEGNNEKNFVFIERKEINTIIIETNEQEEKDEKQKSLEDQIKIKKQYVTNENNVLLYKENDNKNYYKNEELIIVNEKKK